MSKEPKPNDSTVVVKIKPTDSTIIIKIDDRYYTTNKPDDRISFAFQRKDGSYLGHPRK